MADPNPFDQFDAAPAPSTPSGGANPFDQFDGAPQPAVGQQKTEELYRDLSPQPPAPRTTGQDVRQGVAHGLVSAGSTILGFPQDLWHMLKSENKWALTRGAEAAGVITPEQGAAFRQEPAEASVGTSPWIQQHVENLAKAHGKDVSPTQTGAGQYAETAASFIPLAAAAPFTGGESLAETVPGIAKQVGASALRYGAVPAVTSETLGQATKGTAAEPYARMLGAVGPEGLAQAAGLANRAFNPVAHAMEGATEPQLQAAQRILNESYAAGAPLTTAEAVQTATQGGTRLGDIQRVVEQSPRGAEIMRPFMAERPAQTEALGRQAFNRVAPESVDPYAIAPRVQGAAQQAIDMSPQAATLNRSVTALGPSTTAEEAGSVIQPELRGVYEGREGMRNALANQDYAEARAADYGLNGEPTNPVQIRPVIDHIDDLLTSAKGTTASALRTARRALFSNGQPDMTVTGLSNARKAIADQVSAAARIGNNDVTRVLGADGLLGQLDNALEEVPAYGQARRNFARASESLAPFAETTTPGRIIDRDQFNRGFTMPAERVAPTIERGGPSAADQFLTAAENAPASRQAFGQYYSQQLLGSATDAAGRINPDVLANTLRNNQDMLQRFPEISANLNRVGTARRALQGLEQTPTGALAASTGKTGKEQFSAQRNLLFASNPLAGSERTIANTVRAVAARDPVAAQAFVRQHLEQAFNEATQNNLSGPNQFGGPKFAAVVSGNSQQAKNLEAAVRALPQGDLKWNALRKGLDIMEGMGQRQPVGSQTEFNAQINKWMEQGNPAAEFAVTAASPGKWPSMVNNVYRHVMYGRNTAALARAFTSSNIEDLQNVVRSGRRSFQGQMAMIGALGRAGALSAPIQPAVP